jgi:hypothetical protein
MNGRLWPAPLYLRITHAGLVNGRQVDGFATSLDLVHDDDTSAIDTFSSGYLAYDPLTGVGEVYLGNASLAHDGSPAAQYVASFRMNGASSHCGDLVLKADTIDITEFDGNIIRHGAGEKASSLIDGLHQD